MPKRYKEEKKREEGVTTKKANPSSGYSQYKAQQEKKQTTQKATAQSTSSSTPKVTVRMPNASSGYAKHLAQKESTSQGNSSYDDRYEAWVKKNNSVTSIQDRLTNRVNSWLKNNSNYIWNYEEHFRGRKNDYTDRYVNDSAEWLEKIKEQKNNFDAERSSILEELDYFSEVLNPEWSASVKEALSSGAYFQNQIVSNADYDTKYWKQWDSEDEYKEYQNSVKNHVEKMNTDVDAGRQEISYLEKLIDEYDTLKRNSGYRTSGGFAGANQYLQQQNKDKSRLQEIENEVKSRYGMSVNELNSSMAERRRKLNEAEEYQYSVNSQNLANEPDFAQYSAYDTSNTDSKYRYINDSAARDEYQKRQLITNASSLVSLDPYQDYNYRYMTDDETAVYNYYYAKYGKESADKYLNSLQDQLNYRAAYGETAGLVSGNDLVSGAGEFFMGFDAMAKESIPKAMNLLNVSGERKANSKNDYINSILREDVSKDLGAVGSAAYDTVANMGNMLPSILVSGLAGPVAGSALLGASAAGSGYQEMINDGYTPEQAYAYGTLVGASETLMQYLLGGISALGGKISNHAVRNFVKSVDNSLAKAAIQLGGNMISEGIEEAVQEIVEPAFKSMLTGEEYEGSIGDALYSGLLGALTAGLFEIPNVNATRKLGQEVLDAGIKPEDLAKIGRRFPADSVAYELSGKVGETTGAYTIGQMFNEIGATLTEANQADIVRSLTRKGVTEHDAQTLAKALADVVDGVQLNEKQIAALESNPDLSKTFVDVIINPNSTVNQRVLQYQELLKKLDRMDLQRDPSYMDVYDPLAGIEADEIQPVEETPAQNETAPVTEPPVAEVPQVPERDVVETEAPKAASQVETPQVETPQEETPERTSSDTESELQEAAQKYGDQEQAMIHTYREGQDVSKFDAAYKMAYEMGRSGVDFKYVKKSETISYLTDAQKELAYKAGADAAEKNAQKLDSENKALNNNEKGWRKGSVRGEGVTLKELQKKFNDTQKVAYKVLSAISEITGIDIVLYNSEVNENGDYTEAQGKFDRNDPGTVYVDINAGLKNIMGVQDMANYTMVRTFSHEFTHFIEKWSPIQYNEFRRAVFETLTERGANVDELIKDIQSKNGDMAYETASREVVAESMTDILRDSSFLQKLAEKNNNIFQKLFEKLKEFVANIRSYYNSIKSNPSKEAKALQEQVDGTLRYVEDIVQLFDKVATQAVENYQQTTEKTEVAEENVATTTETKVAETKATETKETEVKEQDTKETTKAEPVESKTAEPYVSDHGYTVSENETYHSVEVKFDEKPSEEIRNILKANKFRWNGKRRVWYGKTSQDTITDALENAYKSAENAVVETETTVETAVEATETAAETAAETATETAPDEAKNAEVENDAEQKDVSTSAGDPELRKLLNSVNEFRYNGYEYSIFKWGDNEYELQIRDPGNDAFGGYIIDARSVLYKKKFDSREAAVEEALSIQWGYPSNTSINSNTEVINNGEVSENGADEGTVRQPVLRGEGTSRLLETVESEAVQPGSEGRGSVRTSERDGTTDAGSDGPSDTAGLLRKRGTRDSVGGHLQQLSELSSEQVETQETTTETAEAAEAEARENLKKEVQREIEKKSTVSPKGENYSIGDSIDIPNGNKSRIRANIDAIRIVKELAAEGRYATAEEQAALAKYVGWGGLAEVFGKPVNDYATRKITYEPTKGIEAEFEELKSLLTEEEYKAARESTKNAHYTSVEVIRAMYDGLMSLGFEGGRMLEPSAGVGNFVGAAPASVSSKVKSWTMVELDNITGMIAKYLYPNADVRIQGFEQTNIPDGYMDVAIGNVPFGNYGVIDSRYPKAVTSAIHNYFFAKALDKVRTGGIVMFITSSYTMNAANTEFREYIMQKADLLGAIRLPNTAFASNAGTSVVTDILVLKKRAERTEYAGEEFLDSEWKSFNGGGAYVNKYFGNHPEMVLGTPKVTRGMYSGNELTYDPFTDKGSLGDQIRTAMKNIDGKMDYKAPATPEKANFAQQRAKKKSRKLQINDGVLNVIDENGNLEKLSVDQDTEQRVVGMVGIRDAYSSLCDALQQGVKQEEVNNLRQNLNKAYDEFVAKNGILNSRKNKKALNQFADRYSILSLENYNEETRKATKADIFTKDTIAANRTESTAENVEEGLSISMNRKGYVDAELISKLTGEKEESVTRQLIDQRLVFKDKEGNLIPAAQYLSGNVRAKLREMEGLVGIDPDYRNNVEALRAVVPADVPYTDIYVNPGANWVPTSVYEGFVGHILQRNNFQNYRGQKIFSVEYVPETNEYKININDAYARRGAQNTQVWGEGGKDFATIFENMLNSRRTNVYYTDSEGHRVLDKTKTDAIAEKIEKLNEEFRKWLWDDETRRTEMQNLYNESFNALVTPKYDGKTLSVNGLNSTFTIRPHQKDAVARIINSGGNTLLAHRVGAGKTMEMAVAAMKMKQLGIIKKPMFVVPNNVVSQWGKEFKDYFPASNILLVGDEDMTPAERMTTINKIKNNDYDAVILAYTKFEKIPMTKEWQQKFYDEQISNIMFAINSEKAAKNGKGFTVKQLETKRKQLENKIKKLTEKAKDTDGAMFEDLGVDGLFVDEAHNFKNLEYTTRMNNVSGLGNSEGSQRAFDLYTKVRYLQQVNGGRGIVFATATPVMNSMTEMYIMQRYLQPDTLKQLGIDNFDAWAKMFGEVTNSLEIKPSGTGYRVKQSFSKFKNIKSLQQLFRSFTDVLTDVPGLKIPKLKGGKTQIIECVQSDFQKAYMEDLAKRADNVRNVDPSVDNMLKITSDGRKISYSQRMIDPSLPYEENGKIYKCCENVLKVYKESNATKGTQMIFCDMATPKGKSDVKTESDTGEFSSMDTESVRLYDDMKALLVQMGIPKNEIAFIHDAKNDKQKSALSKKMNEGSIRVLIGSTGKMGVGLNAQVKAVAIHHLDAPWRPGDIEQRDGRVFRQKNENAEAYRFIYVTKGSFDSRLWDILERKQKFINQIMNGEDIGNEVEDTGEVTLSAAEVKAVASGSPLIMEQVALEKEISKLESLYKTHNANVLRAKEKIVEDERKITATTTNVENVREDIKQRKDTYSSDQAFSMKIGSRTFSNKKDAGTALVVAAQSRAKNGVYTTIGKFAGFDLRVIKTEEGIKGILSGAGNYEFKIYPNNPSYGISHLVNIVESLEARLEALQVALKEAKEDLTTQQRLASEPFEKEADLQAKRSKYREVMDELNPSERIMMDDSVQEQSRKYAEDDPSDENYQTDGVNWAIKAGIFNKAEASIAQEAISKIEKLNFQYADAGNENRFVEAGKSLMVVKPEYKNSEVLRIYKFKNETDLNVGGDLIMDAKGDSKKTEMALDIIKNSLGDGSVTVYEPDNPDGVVYQPRARDGAEFADLLGTAAEELETGNWSEGEKEALRIFQKRATEFRDAMIERAQLGRLYRQQQFGNPSDHAAAVETKNRMQVLDEKIERANEVLLEVEKKEVLKRVIQKATDIAARREKARSEELMRQWKAKQKEALAVKVYQERIRNDVRDLNQWVTKPGNKEALRRVPDVIKNPVIQFLSSIDFHSKRSLQGGEPTKADNRFMQSLERLNRAMTSDISVEEMYSGYMDLPEDFMDTLKELTQNVQESFAANPDGYIINQMSSKDLKALSKIVKNLKACVVNTNRFLTNAMYSHVYEAGDNTISELSKYNKAGKTGTVSDYLLWQQMRPAYVFERLGNGGKAIYDELRRGQSQLAFNTKEILDFADATYTEKEVKSWEDTVKTIRLSDGQNIQMPISSIMSFYELSKRPQALQHMLEGGIRAATFTKGKEKIADVGHPITEADVKTIIKELTPRQKEVADNMQTYMAQKGGEWGNYVSVARFGEQLFTESEYFPIHSDGRHLKATADKAPGSASLYALLNMSFTKELNTHANNRILLYSIFDVFANHMSSMAQYNAMALPVLDSLKWLNYQQKEETEVNGKKKSKVIASVREELARVYGTPEEKIPGSGASGYAERTIINILKGYNGTEAQGSPMDSWGLRALHNYNRAQVAFNFRSIVQQPFAIARAGMLMGFDSIVSSMASAPRIVKQNIAEMKKYSGIALWKSMGFYDVNVSRGLTDMIKHSTTLSERITEIGLTGAEMADSIAWGWMWGAAKKEVAKKMSPQSKNYYQEVTKLFEDVVYKTQVVDSILTKTEFMRDKGYWARAMGSFMSEPVTTASMVIDAFDKYNRDIQSGMSKRQAWKANRKNIGRTAYVYAIGALVMAAVQAVADAPRDDDDYQTFSEKWLEAFNGNFIEELSPFGKIPIVSDFYEFTKSMLEKVTDWDIYGYDQQSIFMQWADYSLKGVEILKKLVDGEKTNYTWYGGIYKMLQALSGMTGLPFATITREVVSAWNMVVGRMAPLLKVKTYDAGTQSNIKYALLDGYLTEDEAMQELLNQGISDSENDAYWEVQKWKTGNSRYEEVFNAVLNNEEIPKDVMENLNTHGYAESEVLSAVKSKIGEWLKDGQITKQQAEAMLKKYLNIDGDEAYWTIDKWQYTGDETYSRYNDLYDTILKNGNASEEMNELTSHGYTEESLYSKVRSQVGTWYQEKKISKQQAIATLQKYTDMDDEEIQAQVNKWSSYVVTGIQYDDIGDEYKSGRISSSRAIQMYKLYGGLTEEEAQQKVTVLDFLKKHPEVKDISYAAIGAYQTYCEPAGVRADVFYDVWKQSSSVHADVDANGKAISGSKKAKMLEYIDSLSLSVAQKDSLYYAFGWAQSTIKDAPWH